MRHLTTRRVLIWTAVPLILAHVGCAARRLPAPSVGPSSEITEAQAKVCDELARREVTRLGESVPIALAKGFAIGLAFDLSHIAEAVHPHSGVEDPTLRPFSEARPDRRIPNDSAWRLLPWSVLGGPQLARDAARTNEDVYDQAIQACVAPILLARELGPTNATVATSLELLASRYGWQHKYAQAEPLRRQALAIWETVFAPNDPRVATALEDYASVLRQLHRVAEADALTGRADAIRAELGARVSRAPTTTPVDPDRPRCDSPASAALFVLCRGVRPDAMPLGASLMSSRGESATVLEGPPGFP